MQDVIHDEAPLVDEPWRSPLDELERTLSEVGRALSALRQSLESGGAPQPIIAEPRGPVAEPGEPVSDPVSDPVGEPVNEKPEAKAADEAPPTGFDAVWQRIKKVRQDGDGDRTETADITEEPGFRDPAPASDDHLSDEAQAVGKSRLSSFEGVWERLERERKERSEGDIEDIADVRGLEHLPQSYRITVEDRDGTPVDLVPIHRVLLTFASADNISLVSFANGVPVVSIQTEGELDLERLAATIGAATSRQCEVIPQEKGKLFLRLSSEEGNER